MQKQAAVVQIDRSDGRDLVIGDEALCMYEAGRVLVDPDAAGQQHLIKAAGHPEDQLFVGNAGHDDPHIDAALRRREHGVHQIVAQHEVGRKEPRIVRALREQVDEQLVAGRLAVQGRIVVAEHIAVRFLLVPVFLRRGHRRRFRVLLESKCVPERQEHVGKIPDGLAGQTEAGVLPVPVGMLQIDVAVREVDAAAVGDFVVHDQHLRWSR